jgi:hypothetical protein
MGESFVKVMEIAKRFANHERKVNTGKGLPDWYRNAFAITAFAEKKDFEAAERNLLAWAAEHPDPNETKEEKPVSKPEVICLCGPLRFMDAFRQVEYMFEMQGAIVVGPSFLPGATTHDGTTGCTPEQKIMLDELHKRKIDMCDKVYVINVGGYIGESTKSEIAYAQKTGKPVEYLESRPRLTPEQVETLKWLKKGGYVWLCRASSGEASVYACKVKPKLEDGHWSVSIITGIASGPNVFALAPLIPDWTIPLDIDATLKEAGV